MRVLQEMTVVVALALMWPAIAHSQQSAEELFQAGLYQEEVQGDLEQAIQLYRQLVDEYGSNRAVAARALLHVGQCYEKLGREEAANAYERLLRDYADQSDMAAEARTRLETLRSEQTAARSVSPATRLISDGYPEILRTPLKDGRHLLDYDMTSNTFQLVDIQTGDARPLLTTDTNLPFTSGGAGAFDLSADGGTIVGVLYVGTGPGEVGPGAGVELRAFDVGGGGAGRSLHRWDPGHIASLFGWSPDARRVWTFVLLPDRSAQIVSIDLSNGTLRVLETLAYRDHTQPPSLSPDGRFMTYHDAPDRESPPDIFLLAADGSGEFRVEHPANDSKPVFAPDGSGIVFESDRRGARDLWFLPVAGGRPSGEPRIAWRDIGIYGQVLRFAENGSLFYYFATNEFALYTAEIDVLSHAVGNVEVLPPSRRRMSTAPAWSPDGRRLAYRRGGSQVVVRDLTNGGEREVLVGGGYETQMIDWCGGSASLVVTGYDGDLIAYEVALGSGEVERIPLNRPHAAVCVDRGETIVYERQPGERDSQVIQIVRRSLASGSESVLYEGPVISRSLARSLDGTQLAFVVQDSAEARLVVLPAMGGEAREVMTSSYFESPYFGQRRALILNIAWMPDGQNLLVARYAEGAHEPPGRAEYELPLELWRAPVDGSAAQMIGQLPEQFNNSMFVPNMSVHPDGRRVAFDHWVQWISQVWAIENLLQYIHADSGQ